MWKIVANSGLGCGNALAADEDSSPFLLPAELSNLVDPNRFQLDEMLMEPVSQPHIVVLDGFTLNPGDNPWDNLRQFGELTVHERMSPEDVVRHAGEATIIITNKVRLPATVFARLPKLQMICVTATGYDVVDVAAARKAGILVANVPEYGTDTVAQYTMGVILELCHRIGKHDEWVHSGEWQRSLDWCKWISPQVELVGKTLGILGFGRIGRRLGQIASAFGMKILACAPRRINPPAYATFDWADVEDLFAKADVLTLHCRLTPKNAGIVNSRLLRLMKPGAFLINTSRGALVNEAELALELNRGTIAGVAVDVVSAEPIRESNPLLSAKNCIITPHIAWSTMAARQRIMDTTVANIAAFLSGNPTNIVS